MTSLAAVAGIDVPTRLVVCLGFGVDTYHGVCHAHFLENVATLEREGAYLGAFSVPRTTREGAAFLDLIAQSRAETPNRPSIVNGSIAAAMRGEFGNVQFTRALRGASCSSIRSWRCTSASNSRLSRGSLCIFRASRERRRSTR
jgi:hypothetical protein